MFSAAHATRIDTIVRAATGLRGLLPRGATPFIASAPSSPMVRQPKREYKPLKAMSTRAFRRIEVFGAASLLQPLRCPTAA
jgi:hypothetical protein